MGYGSRLSLAVALSFHGVVNSFRWSFWHDIIIPMRRGVLKDMTGQRFGHWMVMSRAENSSKHQAQWLCQCDCGVSATILGANLRFGKTKSCGCARTEKTKTHGMGCTPEYKTWAGMIDRCHNTKNKGYANYGGRGIKVCDRWSDFTLFFADMGEKPSGLSIDRIDNNGDYEPSNCRWATIQEQQNNKRKNWFLVINGKTKTVAQWAREMGVSPSQAYRRLRLGWSVEVAFGKRSPYRRYVTVGDRTQTIAQWSRELGLPRGMLRSRLNAGWEPEDAIKLQ